MPGVDGLVRERLGEVRLPCPRRAGDTEVLRAGDPFQGGQGVLGGQRDGGVMLAPGREGLPGGQPGGLAPDPPSGLVAAADLFFEQDADHLGGVRRWARAVASTSGAALRR